MSRLTPIKRSKYEKFLKFIGCEYKRQKGDHLVYNRADLKRPIIFPADKEIPVFIIRNNLRTLKMSRKEYLDIFKQI